MPFNFTSPGEAATDALFRFLANREAERRQAFLDDILQQRESRAAQIDMENLSMNQQQLRLQQEAQAENIRRQQEADALAEAQRRMQAYIPGETIRSEDVDSIKQFYPGVLDVRQGAQIGEFGADAGPDMEGVPQYEVQSQFRGTGEQRRAEEDRQKRRDALTSILNDPKSTPVEKQWAKAQLEGVDMPAAVLGQAEGDVKDVGGYRYRYDPQARDWNIEGPSRDPYAARMSGSSGRTTVSERASLGFFNRAVDADSNLEALEQQMSELGLLDETRLKYLPNFMQSDEGQLYQQAQRAFTEARLRKDSGAAIPETEFENDRRTYFVQPGDTAEVIRQKRIARKAVLASLGVQSGNALYEFYGDEADVLLQQFKDQADLARRSREANQPGGRAAGAGPTGKSAYQEYLRRKGE